MVVADFRLAPVFPVLVDRSAHVEHDGVVVLAHAALSEASPAGAGVAASNNSLVILKGKV